jgi:hypothetical protein
MTRVRNAVVMMLALGPLALVPIHARAMAVGGGIPEHRSGATGSGLGAFALSANAPAVKFTDDSPGAPSHPLGEGEIPQALTTLSNGPIEYGLASIAWPGNEVANLGTLLVVLGLPQKVSAIDDPVRAEARNGDGTVNNKTLPGVTMTASVHPTATRAVARLKGIKTSTLVSAGAIVATTSTRLTGPRTAIATAATRIDDISLGGGAIRIGAIVSHATARSDTRHATATGKVTITGMKIAGVPVTVSRAGLTVSSAHLVLPAAAQALVRSTLKDLGVTFALAKPQRRVRGGKADYSDGALDVTMHPSKSNGYSTVKLALGGATVSAHATKASLYQPPPPSNGPKPLRSTTPSGELPGSRSGGLPPAANLPAASTSTPTGQSPQVASLPVTAVSEALPGVPGNLSAIWFVLGLALAVGLGLGVLRRLPTSIDSATARCPREGNR